jgi:adenylate cyclase
VVDDTPDNLFLMNGLLEDRFEVVNADSGRAALEVVMSDNPPDMVLLDIMMPDMDGYEVLRRIRQHAPTASIPVIFLTALAAPQDERLGLELGAVDYLTKPVDPAQVVERIEANARATARARRMDMLSERLASRLSPESFVQLFDGPERERAHFEQRLLTLLFVECPDLAGWSDRDRDGLMAEVEWLATRHHGAVDRFAWGGTAIFFDDPGACVDMSMELQRSASELRLRMGVTTGLCDVATFRCDGEVRSTLIGPETELAAQVAATAASGSIVISPEAYALVQHAVHADIKDCLLMEEFRDSDLATASITPTPLQGGHALSTFAGLGTF